jgi:hypothetical protein
VAAAPVVTRPGQRGLPAGATVLLRLRLAQLAAPIQGANLGLSGRHRGVTR